MLKTSDRPLLANDATPSEHSQDTQDHIAEEDALLTGQPSPRTSRYNGGFWLQVAFLTWAVAATVAAVALGVLYGQQRGQQPPAPSDKGGSSKVEGKRNLIFMVSDGMGPTSLSLTRSFRQTFEDLPFNDTLILDEHLIGQSRTRSSSSLITDSAAGATAFSCGQKSYNGAISVLPDQSPCGTVLEAAKRAGYMTGLVVTTRITDATPACFASHALNRGYEDSIAEQMVGLTHPMGRVVDLVLGGGRCHFLPNSSNSDLSLPSSCRADDTDVISLAQKREDWTYISSRSEFDTLNLQSPSSVSLPLLGLFASTDIPYEIDRKDQSDNYPSLSEMAATALAILSAATRDSEKGFFIMIEGSRIDHAGHSNDPVAQVHEVMAYDKTWETVLSFLEEEDSRADGTPGVVVGTSDHETGGLATALQVGDAYPTYAWYPSVLANASHSASYLSTDLHKYYSANFPTSSGATFDSTSSTIGDLLNYIRSTTLSSGLGIIDPAPAELARLVSSLQGTDAWGITRILADMISRRAGVGWSTHGHSAVDVNIYAAAASSSASSTGKKQDHDKLEPVMAALGGNRENTDVGHFLAQFLDVDVDEITKELNDALVTSDHGGGRLGRESVNGQQTRHDGAVGEEEGHTRKYWMDDL